MIPALAARRATALLALGLGLASSASMAAPPTHCLAGESAVLNAWMAKVSATEGGWRGTKDGKLLSLCADRPKEPFSKLSYRYGVPGSVELEVAASPGSRFRIDSRQTTPHTGEDIVFFTKGPYTYYVTIATGQGRGVSLLVFKGTQRLVHHFSGNEEGEDFQLGPAEIDFSARVPRSPVLTAGTAPHAF